jgi:hypothetical protein
MPVRCLFCILLSGLFPACLTDRPEGGSQELQRLEAGRSFRVEIIGAW